MKTDNKRPLDSMHWCNGTCRESGRKMFLSICFVVRDRWIHDWNAENIYFVTNSFSWCDCGTPPVHSHFHQYRMQQVNLHRSVHITKIASESLITPYMNNFVLQDHQHSITRIPAALNTDVVCWYQSGCPYHMFHFSVWLLIYPMTSRGSSSCV